MTKTNARVYDPENQPQDVCARCADPMPAKPARYLCQRCTEWRREEDAFDQLRRYGPLAPEFVAAIEALARINDDLKHGRPVRRPLITLYGVPIYGGP